MDQGTRPGRTSGHFHAVRFYENSESLCRMIAEFLGEGFVIGQPALVIATPEHRAAIVHELGGRHFDIDQLQTSGDLVLVDAREALSRFMVEGQPDAARFAASSTESIDRACQGRAHCTVRAYGEMVDLLWKDGLTVAAVRLEMLWNQLAMTQDFSLLCGYAMGSFYKDAGVADICKQHSHVLAADGFAAPTAPRPVRIN